MQIVFSNVAHPSNVAKALRRFLAGHDRKLSLLDSKDLVARIYGHADWAALWAAQSAQPSPFDHLVDAAEAAARRSAYAAVLVGYGLAPDVAESAIDAIRPTALADALPPVDIMAGPQADLLGVAGMDAAAFNLTNGGSRLLRAMRAAAMTDPHWARRGGLRAHRPDDPWLVRTLTDMRATPTHGAWAPLAVLCLAELSRLLSVDHPFVGTLLPELRAAIAANDYARLAEPLDRAGGDALLSLVSHVEDLLPIMLSRHAPFPRGAEAVAPPEIRPPWRARFPLDLSRPSPPAQAWSREDLAGFDLFGEGMPQSMLLKVVSDQPIRGFRDLHPAARLAGLDLLKGPAPASGPLERDDILLAASPDGTVRGAVVVRSRAKPEPGAFHVDIQGPFQVGDAGPAWQASHVETFLLAAAIERFEDDVQSWGRTIAPGGRLAIFVSPAREATDAFLRRFVHLAGNRHAASQREMPDLGIDLVIRNATRDGNPAPLPDLHLAPVPRQARQAWKTFEAVASEVAHSVSGAVVARLRPGGLDLSGGDGRPLAGRSAEVDGAFERLSTQEGVDAVRHLIAEAALGSDAALYVMGDVTAVLSRETLSDRDWGTRRGICLVVGGAPGEGERERLLNRFWAAFPNELDAILAPRTEWTPSGAHRIPGPVTRQ